MGRASVTKWLRLRVAFALGVLVLLAVELSGYRGLIVTFPQALLILGIIVTSALDAMKERGLLPLPVAPPSGMLGSIQVPRERARRPLNGSVCR
jgi:hypothetical protein